jgi:hypothetical protein
MHYVCMDRGMDGWLDGWMCTSLAPELLDGFYSYSVCKIIFVIG